MVDAGKAQKKKLREAASKTSGFGFKHSKISGLIGRRIFSTSIAREAERPSVSIRLLMLAKVASSLPWGQLAVSLYLL